MSVKEETEKLLACCICLITDTKLYSLQEANLYEIFTTLMGNEVCSTQHAVCSLCSAELRRAVTLRWRCRRAQALLAAAFKHTHHITIEYIRTIDRVAEKLCLNLKTYHVYNSDSTIQDIKLEDVKEETDFTENIFISEPSIDDYDANDYVNNEDIDDNFNDNRSDLGDDKTVESVRNRNNSEPDENAQKSKAKVKNNKHNIESIESNKKLKDSKARKRKLTKSADKTKRKRIDSDRTKRKPTESTRTKTNSLEVGKTKRVIKRRMADNGFLPDFNFEEFQSKYNVKIDILSKEEQLREIEARKMAPSFTLAAYGCEECGKGFATKQVYEAHTMKHDTSAGAHLCGICGLRFRTRSRSLVHLDAHRLRFTCAACGFLTRTRFIAKNHFLSHAGTTHQCPHCDAVFSKYTSYLTHVRRRHPAMNVACDECGETFVGPNGLRHHKTRVHRNRVLPKPPEHSCASCGVQFLSPAARAAHAQEAGDAGCDADMVPCPVCGESQHSAAALARHAKTCDAPRTRLCQECDKTFVDAASYDTHYQRIHLNIRMKEPPRARSRLARPFICELCGAECCSVSSLAAHQRSHSGARPHGCPQAGCPLRFGTVHNMRRHHRVVHLGQRPQVACGVCGKLLAHAASLKLHVNTVHLKLPAPPRRRRQDDK